MSLLSPARQSCHPGGRSHKLSSSFRAKSVGRPVKTCVLVFKKSESVLCLGRAVSELLCIFI